MDPLRPVIAKHFSGYLGVWAGIPVICMGDASGCSGNTQDPDGMLSLNEFPDIVPLLTRFCSTSRSLDAKSKTKTITATPGQCSEMSTETIFHKIVENNDRNEAQGFFLNLQSRHPPPDSPYVHGLDFKKLGPLQRSTNISIDH
ncbi:hypothetical protein PAAG_11689 [Paracoccidioides lutzii Pb01]|uniref:Uncharacterized protein n=1 Tax=Paracoccidioides lutzii (strain ATCC MYA-826 / Pb01) TaxID=502779 RepID=A0A0A2V240_PARBA|nr:hypothetical protein PAAG_11689 [Paracoccidioides lutzii Pb01]KGQ01563.1 hypothetical protein PAAG_11689 [Paracoccidioides lutzii Pb01]